MRIAATIYVSDVTLRVEDLKPITAGTVGSGIQLIFGEEWNGLTKNVVFRAEGVVTEEVENAGPEVEIPSHVLDTPNVLLRVGIYGKNKDSKEELPTLWADLGNVRASAGGENYPPPTDNTYTILDRVVEDLEDLKRKVDSGGDGGSITAEPEGDTIIITTTLLPVLADGDTIVIGGA